MCIYIYIYIHIPRTLRRSAPATRGADGVLSSLSFILVCFSIFHVFLYFSISLLLGVPIASYLPRLTCVHARNVTVCVCVCVCVWMYARMSVYLCAHVRRCACAHVRMCACAHVRMRMRMCMCMRTRTRTRARACACMGIYMRMRVRKRCAHVYNSIGSFPVGVCM